MGEMGDIDRENGEGIVSKEKEKSQSKNRGGEAKERGKVGFFEGILRGKVGIIFAFDIISGFIHGFVC